VPPDMLMKLQLSMHATGLQHGYLVCWARMGMRIFKVQCVPSFMPSLAHTLKLVHGKFAQSASVVPSTLSEMPDDLRDALGSLSLQVEHLCSCCKSLRLPGLLLIAKLLHAHASVF
jgi:hypothetical protein